MEYILFKHICMFLEERNFFSDQERGLRQELSTTTQLVEVTHYFSHAIDATVQVDVMFFDFAKVFHRVLHNKLLFKVQKVLNNTRITNWPET